jgi:hypothetical protein
VEAGGDRGRGHRAMAAPAPEDEHALGGRAPVAGDGRANDHVDGAAITPAQNNPETAQHTRSSASSSWWSTYGGSHTPRRVNTVMKLFH